MEVRKYNKETDTDLWNEFVRAGKNQTFLFERGFMDYHSDRFEDHSLLLFDEKNALVALIPANISKQTPATVVSHEGLTYGGLVIKKDAKLLTVLTAFYHLLKYLSENQIKTFNLKQIPSFYNTVPTSEIEYIVFLLDGNLYRRDVALVTDQQNKIAITGNIRREGNKAERSNAIIGEDATMNVFWEEVLVPNLQERFGISPVHSLAEITLLKNRFPENIRQFNISVNGKVVAGATLFICNDVVHCQYISATDEGRKSGALNYLFKHLIDTVFISHRYFDFGIVNEENGRGINSGMLFWKESFGGRSMQHDFYSIDTSSYNKLEKYLA